MRHSNLMKKTHNDIVTRIKKAAIGRWFVISEDKVLGGARLHTDIVLKMNRDILIIDVTVPFENGLEALADATQNKFEKYEQLAQEISNDDSTAKVEANVVGWLGFWDPKNNRIINRLCSGSCAKKLRRIIVSETISFSQGIFYEHTNWTAQDSGGPQR